MSGQQEKNMQEPYVFVTVTKTHEPMRDTLTMSMNQKAAMELKELLARALNCLPEQGNETWYKLADRLHDYATRRVM